MPKWIDKGFEHCFKTECIQAAPCHNCKLHKAAVIMWEALEEVELYGRIVHDKPQDYQKVAKDAMRHIQELGK